ncbi:hypothetical protein J6590_065346 [Homalodisca vitripennis]|nr:hypothetical protein J6590_065346 [Homalodisca vitripennis]
MRQHRPGQFGDYALKRTHYGKLKGKFCFARGAPPAAALRRLQHWRSLTDRDRTLPVVTGTERNVVSEDSGVIVEVEVIQQPASATDVSDTTTEIAPVHVPSPPSTEQIADLGHQLQDCVPANKEVTDSKNLDDPALWLVNEALREYFAVHSINQNDSGDFSQSKRQYSDQTVI